MWSRRQFLAMPAVLMAADEMNGIAERYVKLVLAVGVHEPDYVDAYYGPAAWRDEATSRKAPLAAIEREASALLNALAKVRLTGDELIMLRHRYLTTQTESLIARVRMMGGKRFSFDEEARALYDAVPPHVAESRLEAVLAELAKLLPGKGPLSERYAAWQQRFYIPKGHLDAVFRAAVEEARQRTRHHMRLPANESFEIEYVSKQVWSAYNWYQGNAYSLIQVNTDLPVDISFALRLACHEGYPGHHVYNALLEDRLVRGRGWLEYSVYALYSPQSLVAEGTADYGLELAFPGAERVRFLKEVLFPRAGLDASQVQAHVEVQQWREHLDHAVNTAARRYLDGRMTTGECQAFLERYTLATPERAAQRVRFIDKNRAYVINYNHGEDLVRQYMNRVAPEGGQAAWREFERLLSSPRLPSGLKG